LHDERYTLKLLCLGGGIFSSANENAGGSSLRRIHLHDLAKVIKNMTEYRNTRPDSPKGQVYAAFKEGGFVAACKRAEELGIAANRVNGWLENNGSGFQDINDRRNDTGEDEPSPM
jgi:hypothetical protein